MQGVVRVGAVNCAEDPQLCQSQSVNSYPSLVIYPQVGTQNYLASSHSTLFFVENLVSRKSGCG